jgi:3-hydroxyisobutyrate dehydrogenase-like beta-hydroxyacid dehydrogenase
MKPIPDEDVVAADFVLSIVPPGDALSLAEKLAPLLGRNNRKPIYVDCNAVNPPTVERIAAVISDTGAPFVDAGIIGPPPKPGGKATAFYASGTDAPRFATLRDFGLDVRVIEGPIGAASALKMSYAGITKGITALASAMMLASSRAGTAEALHRELSQSQPELLAWFTRQVPLMYSKAYRWVAEMEEIAGFVSEDRAAADMFGGTARFYERIARDEASTNQETQALSTFLKVRR